MSLVILHTEASSGWGGQELRILDEAAGLRARAVMTYRSRHPQEHPL